MNLSRKTGMAAALAAMLSLVQGIGGFAAATPAAKPAVHTVLIEGLQFHPDTLSVRAGDTVVWVNKDPFPHTATSQQEGFDSHEIGPGNSWRYTVRKKGVFPYVCTLHPTMKAVLRAE